MENVIKVIELLKRNKYVSEIGMYSYDECVGIEEGEIYITITHDIKLYNNREFTILCDNAKLESWDWDGDDYETQLVFVEKFMKYIF